MLEYTEYLQALEGSAPKNIEQVKPILCHWCGMNEVAKTGEVCKECETCEDYQDRLSAQTKPVESIIKESLVGSYDRGIYAGITEAQIILLNILNECKFQITVDQLRDEFMKRTEAIAKTKEQINH